MYRKFHVKNFRCFEDLQINDLGRVNLIAGMNNTGKTALMEAMYIHSGNRDSKTLLRMDRRGSYRAFRGFPQLDAEDDLNTIVSWDTVFYEFNSSEPIQLVGGHSFSEDTLFDDSFDSSVTISVKPLDSHDIDDVLNQLRVEDFDRYTNMEILQLESDFDRRFTYLAIVSGRVLPSKSRSKRLFHAEFLHAHEKVDSGINATRFSSLRQADYLEYLLEALQVIETRLTGLELLFDGRGLQIHADIGLSKLLSITHLGDGMNRINSLILAMGEVPRGIIFIDEIENGIHHKVQKDLWSVIEKLSRKLHIQVFATTHSLEMIRAAYEAFTEAGKLEDFRYHRLDRDDDTGDIKAVTYNELDLDAVATFDFDFEVRG